MPKYSKQNGLEEEKPCLYCGKKTKNTRYIINPKAPNELPCCSEKCYEMTKEFIDWDSHNRLKYYVVLFVLVVINLIFIGFNIMSWWRWIPMLLIGATTMVFPLIFVRYENYQRLGIKTSLIFIRLVGAALAILAFILMVM